MPEKIGKPTDRQPDEWEQELHGSDRAGENYGLEGPHPEKENVATAYDIKDLHRQLSNYTDDELKQIPVLPPGSRLEQGATYIDLTAPERREFTAMGGMEASTSNWYVPKTEVDYQLWNRLIGVQNPERTGEGNNS